VERLADDPDFQRGERLYAEGSFWEAHEAWELLWNRETDPSRRDLVQGLILLAAAAHKLLVMQRPDRAPGMVERAFGKLAPLPDVFEGLDIAELRARSSAWGASMATSHALGTLDLATYDRSVLPRLRRA
jgi:hypothetical protein